MSDLISRQDAIDAAVFGITYAKAFNKDTGEVRELFKESNDALRDVISRLESLPSAHTEIIQCKECKHFEYDHIENVNGIPLIVAHEICTRWCDGAKTSENGYCFLAERKEE